MKRFGAFLAVILAAMLIAGSYGALHDQISYTVSPEYFTTFKFPTFGLDQSPLPERVRAAWVGFLASWWMGALIGVILGGVGFIHRDPCRMISATLRAYVGVIAVAMLFALAGLAYGWLSFDPTLHARYPLIARLETGAARPFYAVGMMHNASYLGGVIGIIAGIIIQRRRARGNIAAEPR